MSLDAKDIKNIARKFIVNFMPIISGTKKTDYFFWEKQITKQIQGEIENVNRLLHIKEMNLLLKNIL